MATSNYYVIDKRDGYAKKSNAVYATARSAATSDSMNYDGFSNCVVGQDKPADYDIYRGLIYLDTSRIGATSTISAASLWVYVNIVNGSGYQVQIQNGQGTGKPTEAYPVVGDYDMTHYSGDMGKSVDAGSLSVGAWNEIPLTAAGIAAINKTGITKFCLRSTDDIASNPPIGAEFMTFRSPDVGDLGMYYLQVTHDGPTQVTIPVTATNKTSYTDTEGGGGWASVHDAASSDSVETGGAAIGCWGSGADRAVYRQMMEWDTSSLPDDAIIESVTIKLWVVSGGVWSTHIVRVQTHSDPASPMLVNDNDESKWSGDFAQKTIATTDTPAAGWRYWDLDSDGIAEIDVAGSTFYGLREEEHDVDDADPVATSYYRLYKTFFNGERYPALIITYREPVAKPREVHVKFNNRTGTITYRENDATYLMEYEYEPNENRPKRILLIIDNSDLTPAVNLLNASCAQWSSGTAALEMGDLVRLGLYQSDDSTVDVLFDGVITDIQPVGDGAIAVEARDPSARLEHEKPIFTHGANYLDETVKAVTVAGSIRYIGSVTEADIVEPMVKVAFAHTDTTLELSGDNDNSNDISGVGEYVEQAFISESDHFIGVRFRWGTDWTIGSQANLDISIFTDDDNTPGNLIKKVDVFLQQGIDTTPTDVDFTTSNTPLRLVKGQKYWLRIAEDGISLGGGTHFSIISQDTALTYWMDEFYHEAGGGRSTIANELLDIRLHSANYEELEGDDFWFDDTANRIYLLKINEDVTTVAGGYYSINRGLVSYYYGTITKEQLCERLITANSGLLKDLSTNLDRAFGVYSTRGKALSEALMEVMDVAENSGSWDGYQSVMAHYLDGSDINRLKVSKKKKTSDPATYILSHPSDRANDEEHIIIGEPALKKTTKRNYARVTITGRGYDGEALVCTRSDESKSGGFWAKMSGIAETLKVTDENQSTLVEVDKRAYALLDAVQRDVWQGSIMLDGQHEDMFDWDPNSETYGSGNIITMYWGPLGIDAVKMKVTGMVLRRLDTEIYVNNVDTLLDNRLTRGWNDTERSASFISQVGVPEVVYGRTYTGTIITTATLWMELCDSGGAALPSQDRQLCTRFSNTDYNQIVYHAEFEAGNAHIATIGGVGQIKLYTTKTGVSPQNTIDLTRTVSSIVIDEEVDKFKQSKLIFEVLADAS